jgi:hypothetical protein
MAAARMTSGPLQDKFVCQSNYRGNRRQSCDRITPESHHVPHSIFHCFDAWIDGVHLKAFGTCGRHVSRVD